MAEKVVVRKGKALKVGQIVVASSGVEVVPQRRRRVVVTQDGRAGGSKDSAPLKHVKIHRPKGAAGTPLPEGDQIIANQVPTLQRVIRSKVEGGGVVLLGAGGSGSLKVPADFKTRSIEVFKHFHRTEDRAPSNDAGQPPTVIEL